MANQDPLEPQLIGDIVTDSQKKVVKLWKDNEDLVTNLFVRWGHEKEYEDIKDYGEIFRPKVEEIGGTFVKMLKRPFGFNFQLDGAKYRISINSKVYKYQRLK